MKKTITRILSVILLLSTFISLFSLYVYAIDEKSVNTDNIDEPKKIYSKNILSFSCHYNPQSKTVNLKGTMDYDAFALHGDSTLLIYAIPAGKTEDDIINDSNSVPIAESPVSISFAFSFNISSIEERYYRYAIFLRSSEGEYILTTEAQYAEVDANFVSVETKDSFKGLSGEYSSNISNIYSQTTIIPIYLDLVYTDDASGYIYQADDLQISFNKNYIDEIDTQMRSISLFGTTVYLQFLLRSGGILQTHMNDGAEYALPDTFDNQTIVYLHALTDFLISRYSNSSYGNISGIILGKAWDNAPKYNSFKDISFEKYISMCGNYATIISNAARDINPAINIVLSFDGNGFFVEQKNDASTNDRFSAKDLLTSLMEYFDASNSSGLKSCFLIETSETPFDITSNELTNGIDINKKLDADKFYIGNQNYISDFLNDISKKYRSATKYYNLLWIPKKELRGNALCAAYAYAFYELLTDNNIVSFTVEFSTEAENSNNLVDLLYILKNIDSKDSFEATQNLLTFFNEETWADIIGKEIIVSNQRKHYSANVLKQLPKNIKGCFSYFDFSQEFLPDGWVSGAGSSDLRIDYLLTGEKALKGNFTVGNKDFCDIIYLYEYSENISYTPYIKFNIEIISKESSPLFEIKFFFNGKNSTVESKEIIVGNKQSEIILDMTNVKDFSLVDSVKISIRSLDNTVNNCTLCIHDIKGYSEKYNNEELKSFIEKERDKQKHANINSTYALWWRIGFVVLIIAISAIFGFILIFILQRNSRNKRKD